MKKSVALILSAGVALASCGDDEDVDTDPVQSQVDALESCDVAIRGEFYLASAVPLTGSDVSFGESMLAAHRVAVESVNSAGGINGRTLGLLACDSGCDETVALRTVGEIANVDAIVGSVGPVCSAALIPYATQGAIPAGLPIVSGSSTSPLVSTLDDNDLVFRTIVSDASQGVVLAQVAYDDGARDAYVVARNDVYGQGLSASFTVAFEGLGGSATVTLYDEDSPTYASDAIDAAQTANPDVGIVIGFEVDTGDVLIEAASRSFKPSIGWLGGEAHISQAFVDRVNDDAFLEGHRGVISGVSDSPELTRFQTRFRELTGGDPEVNSAHNYDAVYVLAIAAALSDDPTDRSQIAANLASGTSSGMSFGAEQWADIAAAIAGGATSIDYQGASGPVDFDANGDVFAPYTGWEVRGGQVVSEGCFNADGSSCD
ncbi:MAG: ABC transporter substrate-binding protein [Myxococcota bacterium]